jgi:hypothetical protein
MEDFFGVISLVLFSLAVGTMVTIVREARPHLSPEDRDSFRKWMQTGFATAMNRGLNSAWNEHSRSFPGSRKRKLFVAFLIAAAISIMFYPLWLAVGPL